MIDGKPEVKEIWSVSQIRDTLREIDDCKGRTVIKNEDGSINYDEPCTAQVMCDSCLDKFYSLLEWAVEGTEDDTTNVNQPPNCS